MGRLPYDKQMELAYQIYEALCAQHPDWLVALSDTRTALQKRAAAALATRPTAATTKVAQRGTFSVRRSINSGANGLC